jgi:ribosomal protein L7/L12
MIEAIKLLRELRGLSLADAHDAVAAMVEGRPSPPSVGSSLQRLSPAQAAAHPAFQRLIAADERINAIKFYKEATGCGLKEAKEAMDRAVAAFEKK